MKRMILFMLLLAGIVLNGCQGNDSGAPTPQETDDSAVSVPDNDSQDDVTGPIEPENSEEKAEVPVKNDETTDENDTVIPDEDETNEQADETSEASNNNNSNETVQSALTAEDFAEDIVLALSNQDMQTLSTYVHPSSGVRFSPYSYVNVQSDLVFTTNQIQGLLNDSTLYNWGNFDGTGDLIQMTFFKLLYDLYMIKTTLTPEQTATNSRLGAGSSIDNSQQVYPNSTIIEYHFSGFDPNLMGMDWRSLRLVIEQVGNQWWLVGIIHDEWTI